MSININYQVHNAYNVAGSNFQKGLKAGNGFIGQLNPGVEVGHVHAYTISNPLQETNITSLNGTGPSTQYFQLANAPATTGKIVKLNGNEQALQMDYPRRVTVECNVPCKVTFNIIDRYGKQVVNTVTASQASVGEPYYASTNVGVNYLLSAQFSTTDASAWSAFLKNSNEFELPYTDLGSPVFLESVTAKRQDGFYSDIEGAIPLTATSTISENVPYFYQLDIAYQVANWETPITLTSGNPRPFIVFKLRGEAIVFPTDNDYSFMIKQNVFPYYNPKLKNWISEQQALDGTSTYGLPCKNDGFTGWRG